MGLIAAYEAVQIQYDDFLVLKPEILEVTEQAIKLAEAYQRRQILTPKYYTMVCILLSLRLRRWMCW